MKQGLASPPPSNKLRPKLLYLAVSCAQAALACKGKRAVWRRPRVAQAEKPSAFVRRDCFLRILARTGRSDCRHPCASFPPSSGFNAMSILCVARWRRIRGMIDFKKGLNGLLSACKQTVVSAVKMGCYEFPHKNCTALMIISPTCKQTEGRAPV